MFLQLARNTVSLCRARSPDRLDSTPLLADVDGANGGWNPRARAIYIFGVFKMLEQFFGTWQENG